MKVNKRYEGVSIIALVGPIAAGKGIAAELLVEQGYAAFNYGDVIYQERTARGLKEKREISNAVGADLRLKFGNDIIARRIACAINCFIDQEHGQKIVIDGLRHPDEVLWVKKNLGARVIGVTADPEIRYARTLKRNRIVDPTSPEAFMQVDKGDRGIGSERHENQSDLCILRADIVIENDGDDLQVYKEKIYAALQKLGLQETSKKLRD